MRSLVSIKPQKQENVSSGCRLVKIFFNDELLGLHLKSLFDFVYETSFPSCHVTPVVTNVPFVV